MEQNIHEIKEYDVLRDPTITKRHVAKELSEPDYDLVDDGQHSHSDIKMTSNPAYNTGNTVKLEA